MILPAPDAPRRSATVARKEPVGAGLVRVVLEPAPAQRASYARPGQYVWVAPPVGDGGYFVLAGDPGTAPWEFVIRGGGDAADWLLAAAPGAPVAVTDALGAGFDLDAARGEVAAVAVTAGAIAFARCIVRARIGAGDAARTHVFVGVAGPDDVPLADELASFRAEGARVIACLASGAPSHPWEERGTVAEALERRLAEGLRPVRVYMAGNPAMMDGLRALAGARGLVLDTNY
jgi:NAD(P)H-flavin reductase